MSISNSYKEYPIRCHSCNELVDERLDEFFEHQDRGLTEEEALNEMNVFAICTREAFINPPHIQYDMENKKALEGRIKVTPELRPSKEDTESKSIRYGSAMNTSRSSVQPREVEFIDFNPERLRPTIVGRSVINRDLTKPEITKYVGAGRYSVVVNGRQHICN